jgi:hypothetical protein
LLAQGKASGTLNDEIGEPDKGATLNEFFNFNNIFINLNLLKNAKT